MEAKRQQRKLNFLITQTELYAHFMANKMTSDDGKEEAAKEEEILGQLDDNKATGRLAEIETYDCDAVKRQAFNNASQAVEAHLDRTRAFDQETTLAAVEQTPNTAASSAKRGGGKGQDRPQPTIFQGTLKQYQLKGMNWQVFLPLLRFHYDCLSILHTLGHLCLNTMNVISQLLILQLFAILGFSIFMIKASMGFSLTRWAWEKQSKPYRCLPTLPKSTTFGVHS